MSRGSFRESSSQVAKFFVDYQNGQDYGGRNNKGLKEVAAATATSKTMEPIEPLKENRHHRPNTVNLIFLCLVFNGCYGFTQIERNF